MTCITPPHHWAVCYSASDKFVLVFLPTVHTVLTAAPLRLFSELTLHYQVGTFQGEIIFTQPVPYHSCFSLFFFLPFQLVYPPLCLAPPCRTTTSQTSKACRAGMHTEPCHVPKRVHENAANVGGNEMVGRSGEVRWVCHVITHVSGAHQKYLQLYTAIYSDDDGLVQ